MEGALGPGCTLTVRSRSEDVQSILRGDDTQRAVDIACEAARDHQREGRCLIPFLDQHVDVTVQALRARSDGKGAWMKIERTAFRQDLGGVRSGERPRDAACGNVEQRATLLVDGITLLRKVSQARFGASDQ